MCGELLRPSSSLTHAGIMLKFVQDVRTDFQCPEVVSPQSSHKEQPQINNNFSQEKKPRGYHQETKRLPNKHNKGTCRYIKMVDDKNSTGKKNAAVKKFREKERKEKVEREAREKKAKQLREDNERLRKKNEELRQSEKRQKEFLKKCREAKQ